VPSLNELIKNKKHILEMIKDYIKLPQSPVKSVIMNTLNDRLKQINSSINYEKTRIWQNREVQIQREIYDLRMRNA
jgi:hypothetical protein